MRWMVGVAVLALCACEKEISPQEQARLDDRDVAMVERANRMPPPLREVTPDPILPGDRERYAIKPGGCSFSPGFSMSERVIATPVIAFVKIEDEMMRFAADVGSAELPSGVRSQYFGRNYSLQLQIGESADGKERESSAGPEGTVTLRDAQGRMVYSGSGMVHCEEWASPPARREGP